MNRHHSEILNIIKESSGEATQHTFLDNYLGNTHPRYAINAPTLRLIGKEWTKDHKKMSAADFQKLLTSLIEGESATEKFFAGILLDASTAEQRKFDPRCFEQWLDHLHGWAEVDTVCTGPYTITAIPENFPFWKKILTRLSKSKNINKRRASLAFLCSPLRRVNDERLAQLALENVDRLKHEREILITKAISWVLRSMTGYHKGLVETYIKKNQKELPSIAVRETMTKLRTGRKTARL
jgi:3-methyladenine DNA glycosylase AlkD